MGFTMSQQSLSFLYSIVLGIVVAVIFECVVALISLGLKSKIVIFILDTAFFITTAILTFMFSLSFSNGVIRIYTVFGEIAGFVIFRLTLARVLKHIYKYLHLFLSKFIKKFKKFIKKVLKAVTDLLYNIKKDNVS